MYILGSKAKSVKFVSFIIRRAIAALVVPPRGLQILALLKIKQTNFALSAFDPRIYIQIVILAFGLS